MVLDNLKNSFDDAVKRTKDAVRSIEDATEGKDEKQLESEYEQEMNQLVREYKEQLVKTIFSCLDNQEFKEAQRIAREEGGVDNKGWNTIIQTYINHRLKRGQMKLNVIKVQLEQAEMGLNQAKDASSASVIKMAANQAVEYYEKIEQDEILEAQRDISRAENVSKKFGDSAKAKKIFRKEHKDVNRLDKDVEKAEKDLLRVIKEIQD